MPALAPTQPVDAPPQQSLLAQDTAPPDQSAFTLNPVQNAQQAQQVNTAQEQASVAQHATPQEQVAPPSTPLDDETTQASQGIVNTFNQYVAAGNDIGKLSKDEIEAVITGAAALPPIEHPETDAARMLMLYKKGAVGPTTADLGLVGKAAQAFLGTAVGLGGATLDALSHFTGHSILDKGFGEWLDYYTKQNTATAMAARSIPDNYSALVNGAKDIWAATALKNEQDANVDPDKGAQLDVKQSEIIRQRMLRETAAQNNMTQVRDAIAGTYKQIGADNLASAAMSVKPDDPLVQTAQVVTDPMTYLMGGGEALLGKAFGGTVKAGVRMQRFTEAGIRVGEIEDKLATTALARTNLEAVLNSPVPLTDTARAGIESNISRIKAVQGNLSATYDTAKAEQATALQGANSELTKMATSDPVRGAMGQLMQSGGAAATKVLDAFSNFPEAMADRFVAGGTDAEKAAFANSIRRVGTGVAAAASGHPLTALVAITGAGADVVPGTIGKTVDLMTRAARNFSTVGEQLALGQQTLPYLRAVADKTTGLTSTIASKLDSGLLAPLIYASPKIAAGTAIGGGIGAVQGYLQSGGDPTAAAQGFGSGALFGAAGSGLGQIGKFNSPGELRQAAIGDRSRFIKALAPADLKLFNQLHPENQLAVSVYGMAHPDLDVHFFADKNASNGSWTPANPRGSVQINVLGSNPVEAILSHEIGHHIAEHGLGNAVDAYIRGNVVTGQPGLTTALGPDGKPMTETDPVTGKTSFVQNDMFQRAKADYNGRKLRDNPHATPEDDYGIAQEIFADLHASYMSDPATLQKAIRGHIPSDIVSENAVNSFFRKTGMGNDATTGNPVPTGDLSNVRGLRDILQNYYKQRQYKAYPIDTDRGATNVPIGDVIKGTPEFDRLVKNLDSTGDLVRNPDGSIKTDLSGRPIAKTKTQADADHAALTNAVLDRYRAQPGLSGPENGNGLKLVTDRNGRQVYRGQVVPDQVFDEIAATNQHNSNQILNWRKLNGIMARDDGTMTNGVYNTATKGKGRYATVEARERALVPLYTEISPNTRQVNFQMYDPETMQGNLVKVLRGKRGKALWGDSLGPAVDDVRTYLDNLANNRPGEAGIGIQKKGVINEMFGINADANPYVTDVMKRSPSVFKTFRLDRMNRINELPANEPVSSQTYEQVRSFMQPREEPVPEGTRFQPRAGDDLGNDGHREAIRATIGNPKAKDPVAKLDYGITSAPLLGGSAVSSTEKVTPGATPIDQARMDSQFKYLNGVERDRLQHLASNGAVDKLGNRIVKEFAKWKDNPDIQAGMGWYSRMREKLRQVFGGDHDLFTQLLGATSARTPVDTNFLQSADAFQQHKAGKFDRHINEYLTSKKMREDGTMLDHALENNYQLPITDEKTGEVTGWRDPKSQAEAQTAYLGAKDAIPRQSNGQKFNANSMQVLKVLAGTWLDESKAPKTPNFAGNLSGRTLQATIDVWAARMLRRIGYEGKTGGQPWRILPKSETGVSNLDFAFSQLAMEHAAKKLGMNPDDLQAVAWFAEKHHWDNKGWTHRRTEGQFRRDFPPHVRWGKTAFSRASPLEDLRT